MNINKLVTTAISMANAIDSLTYLCPELANHDKIQRLIEFSTQWTKEFNACMNAGDKEVSHV